MRGLWNASVQNKKVSEALAVHFTSLVSAKLILSAQSHGLRASKVGQAGGGLSVVYCDNPPVATPTALVSRMEQNQSACCILS